MPSFKASDELTSKPAWLTAADQLTCFGADAAETALSGLVMHQGWTVPAGGNGNALAQRETIACVNMTSDIDTDTDFSKETSGAESFVSFGGTDTFGYLTGNSPNLIVDSNESDHSWSDNGATIECNWARWYLEESTWDAGDGGGPFAALLAQQHEPQLDAQRRRRLLGRGRRLRRSGRERPPRPRRVSGW